MDKGGMHINPIIIHCKICGCRIDAHYHDTKNPICDECWEKESEKTLKK